jgi:DNA-binding response OmpR family regulator
MKVLTVDDDVDLLDLLSYTLWREGYTVLVAIDGQQALARWEAEQPDIVLLDANLPKLNGYEVCRRIRHEHDSDVPIIMLTGRDEEEDILRGFNVGADDYVVKPFSAKQLTTRMKAVLRRCSLDPHREPTTSLRVGDLTLDPLSYSVTRAGRSVPLTALEFRILYILAMNPGRVIPYSRMVEYAWGYEGGSPNLLKTHICHIRQKLGMTADQPGGISALPGVGYSLART